MKPQNFQEYLGGIKFKNTEKKEDQGGLNRKLINNLKKK